MEVYSKQDDTQIQRSPETSIRRLRCITCDPVPKLHEIIIFEYNHQMHISRADADCSSTLKIILVSEGGRKASIKEGIHALSGHRSAYILNKQILAMMYICRHISKSFSNSHSKTNQLVNKLCEIQL